MKNKLKRSSRDLLPYCREQLRERIHQCLWREGIKTLGDICAKTDYELLRVPNFGVQSLMDVKNALLVFNLELAKNPSEHKKHPCLLARWQPIETAPKDGTIILATNSEWVATMSFMSTSSSNTSDGYFHFRGVFGSSKNFDLSNQPTHWVRLPRPLEPH